MVNQDNDGQDNECRIHLENNKTCFSKLQNSDSTQPHSMHSHSMEARQRETHDKQRTGFRNER